MGGWRVNNKKRVRGTDHRSEKGCVLETTKIGGGKGEKKREGGRTPAPREEGSQGRWDGRVTSTRGKDNCVLGLTTLGCTPGGSSTGKVVLNARKRVSYTVLLEGKRRAQRTPDPVSDYEFLEADLNEANMRSDIFRKGTKSEENSTLHSSETNEGGKQNQRPSQHLVMIKKTYREDQEGG